MPYARRNARRRETGAELHDAAGVAGGDDLGRGGADVLELRFEHGARHLGLEQREESGAAATFGRTHNRHELKQGNRREHLERLRHDALRVHEMTRWTV